MYSKFIKKILFLYEPEKAHALTFKALALLDKFKILDIYNYYINSKSIHKNSKLLNLIFKNKVGLAAGLDKNGEYLSSLSKLGFGFIELGTVTPVPQLGNHKPRLFRVADQQALINRMGFNNLGVDELINKIKKNNILKKLKNNDIVLGINIGKNASTPTEPMELAINDYLISLEKVYLYCDYVCLNISSPNTLNLRLLQSRDYLEKLLSAVKIKQLDLNNKYNQSKYIAVKISPDLTSQELIDIADLIMKYKIDILITTNTTIEDKLLYDEDNNKIAGGLSGKPLFDKSNHILSEINQYFISKNYRKNLIIIGVGGINSKADAELKISLGADLVQIYTGLIYQGPSLVRELQNI